MATIKWATPSALTSDLDTSGVLDSLADGSTMSGITYSNSSNLDRYALITIKLGSFTPGSDPYLQLRVVFEDGDQEPEGSLCGDIYRLDVSSGTGSKVITFPMVALYPFELYMYITNNTGAALASSGNEVYLRPYNEAST